jgi:Family of unknown function (DUF6263)
MSVIAFASLLATQSTVTLLFQPKVGTTYKQSTSMSQTSQMGNSTTSMTTTTKVLGIENGFYKLQSTPSNIKMTGGMGANDQVKKAMEKPSTIYMDKHFKPKVAANSSAGMQQMMGGASNPMAGITFPSKPVKVGETWTNTIDMGAMMGAASKGQPGAAGMKSSGKLTLTYKLLKIEASTVTIGTTLSGTVNMDMAGGKGTSGGAGMKMSMTMSGGGTSTMERSTGIPIGSDSKMSMQMGGMGQAFSMNQVIKTKRI